MSQYMFLFTKNPLVDKPVHFNTLVRCDLLYEALQNHVAYGELKILTPNQINFAIEDAEGELQGLKERRKEYKEIKEAAVTTCNIELLSDTNESLRDIKEDIEKYRHTISNLYFLRSMSAYCDIYAGIEIEDLSLVPYEQE